MRDAGRGCSHRGVVAKTPVDARALDDLGWAHPDLDPAQLAPTPPPAPPAHAAATERGEYTLHRVSGKPVASSARYLPHTDPRRRLRVQHSATRYCDAPQGDQFPPPPVPTPQTACNASSSLSHVRPPLMAASVMTDSANNPILSDPALLTEQRICPGCKLSVVTENGGVVVAFGCVHIALRQCIIS